jgi:hypothetical protein
MQEFFSFLCFFLCGPNSYLSLKVNLLGTLTVEAKEKVYELFVYMCTSSDARQAFKNGCCEN